VVSLPSAGPLTISHKSGDTTVLTAAVKAPKFFREAGYRCPSDPKDGLMQYAFNSKLSSFDLLAAMPNILQDFNTFMGNTMGARNYWTDWYPVQERLLDGADPDSALLVDVGGGKGHDILAFHDKYPGQGRLVLEELGAVTNSLGTSLSASIEVLEYDFFKEQPVKGKIARNKRRPNFYLIHLRSFADI
jgi:hypothetical protein